MASDFYADPLFVATWVKQSFCYHGHVSQCCYGATTYSVPNMETLGDTILIVTADQQDRALSSPSISLARCIACSESLIESEFLGSLWVEEKRI